MRGQQHHKTASKIWPETVFNTAFGRQMLIFCEGECLCDYLKPSYGRCAIHISREGGLCERAKWKEAYAECEDLCLECLFLRGISLIFGRHWLSLKCDYIELSVSV